MAAPRENSLPSTTARTASETVAEQIRSLIATGQVAPGDMLPSERVLLDRYQVARPTMRGALRILESDGLVTIERGTKGGARVAPLDLAPLARRVGLHLQLRGTDLWELIEAQAIIQPGAVALAAAARTPDDLDRLRAAVDRAGDAATVADFVDAVSAFTATLLGAAHNRALTLYSELTGALLRDGLHAYRWEDRISGEEIEDAMSWSVRQYGALVDLIGRQDAERAEALWRRYLRRTGAAPNTRGDRLELYRPPGAGDGTGPVT